MSHRQRDRRAEKAQTPAHDGHGRLVLDQLVRDWLAVNAGWSVRLDWRGDYRIYVGNGVQVGG